ncbi:helix-turn-helix domain-containing protein [Vagococcus vulneris]|uniref:Mga helix-turn-helix domain-containing protein n=1 Tax=Vagococcus vulneris TaxID=1977869 RepID=A0A429ZSX4_9ENTE|nr:helix-turn-helix domain-containing protein [Vagococcus vulneris]RST96738.1 hypothetical protein CBF37_10780 [Vagococcus vulneris]
MEKHLFNILSNHNQTILSILDIISENNRWYSVTELSMQLNVVERTVQRYLNQLEEIVATYNEGDRQTIKLSYEKYKGAYLEIERGSNFIDFKNYILSNDESILILKEIMFEDFDSVKKYAMKNYVSEGMVRRSLKKIKDFLNLYHIDLARNSFKLIGEEKQIRLVAFILSWVTFKGISWPFDSISQDKVYNSVDTFSQAMKLDISIIHRKQMAYILAINLIRLRKNHIIKLEESWKNYVDLNSIKESVPFLKSFMSEYNMHIEAEVYYYIVLMQTKAKIYDSEELKKRIITYHKKKNSDIYQATNLFIQQFESNFSPIPIELEKQFFITSFCAHIFAKLFKNINMDIDGHPLFEDIDEDFPILKDRISLLIDELYQLSGNSIFLEKQFLMQKYLLLFSSFLPLTSYEPPIYIYLESDLPSFIKQNITTRLTDRFKHDFNLTFLPRSKRDDADLIFTNIPNLIEEKNRFEDNLLLFDFPLKSRDIVELEHKLKLNIQKKSHNLSEI